MIRRRIPAIPLRARGFTLIELTVVLVLTAIMLSFAAISFGSYQARTAARRAAQLFGRDLALARSAALRTRDPVIVRFHESDRWYEVVTDGGDQLLRRLYDGDGDFMLEAIDLEVSGDSLVVSGRGAFDLSGVVGLGTAVFTAGAASYRTAFNAMGASKVEEH